MAPDVRLIREEALRRLVPVSHSTLFRWQRDGKFPVRIRIGSNAVAWRLAEIEEWIAHKSDQATQSQAVDASMATRANFIIRHSQPRPKGHPQ